jgi:hypothetical protein
MRGRPILIGALVALALVAVAVAYALSKRPPPSGGTLGRDCREAKDCDSPQACVRGTCSLRATCGLVAPPSSGGPFQLVSRELDGYAVGLRGCCRGDVSPYWADLVDLRTAGPGDTTTFDVVPAKDASPAGGFFLVASPSPDKGARSFLSRADENNRLMVGGLDPDPVADPHKFNPGDRPGALWGLLEGGALGDPGHRTLAGAVRCPPVAGRAVACDVPGVEHPPRPLATGVPYAAGYTTDACENDPAFRWDLRPAPRA